MPPSLHTGMRRTCAPVHVCRGTLVRTGRRTCVEIDDTATGGVAVGAVATAGHTPPSPRGLSPAPIGDDTAARSAPTVVGCGGAGARQGIPIDTAGRLLIVRGDAAARAGLAHRRHRRRRRQGDAAPRPRDNGRARRRLSPSPCLFTDWRGGRRCTIEPQSMPPARHR